MTISSSLNASVAGMAAQASAMAAISDNIANSQTAGYRRVVTDFASMVLDPGGPYVAGGVRATDLRLVTERGTLTGTTNATDLAVTGRGMLPVTGAAGLRANAAADFLLTPTGSFRPDRDGILVSPQGFALLGVPIPAGQADVDFLRTGTDALEPVRVPQVELLGSPSTRVGVAANLPARATEAGSSAPAQVITTTYYDNLGKAQPLTLTFTPVVPATGASNEWTLSVADGAQGGAVVGEYTLRFDDDRANGGRLAAVTAVAGGAWDPATGQASLTLASGPLALDLGRAGQTDGMTQVDAGFTPTRIDRDGAAPGTLAGVSVDPDGILVAQYTSGLTRPLYRIPVVDVPNPNGLAAVDGQAYRLTRDSGPFYLWNASTGPAGAIQGYAREESAVDVAQEITRLIITQRAYSSNAKVIQTVDEMLQETANLKR